MAAADGRKSGPLRAVRREGYLTLGTVRSEVLANPSRTAGRGDTEAVRRHHRIYNQASFAVPFRGSSSTPRPATSARPASLRYAHFDAVRSGLAMRGKRAPEPAAAGARTPLSFDHVLQHTSVSAVLVSSLAAFDHAAGSAELDPARRMVQRSQRRSGGGV